MSPLFTSHRKSRTPPQAVGDWNSQSPPDYKEAIASNNAGNHSSSPNIFPPTNELQIEALGYTTNQALSGTKTLENISIYNVENSTPTNPKYTSIRLNRNSNSCALVRVSDPQNALISTIYRWGPGRHPRMHILPPDAEISVEQAINVDTSNLGDSVEVKSRSIISRAQVFDTSFGKFEWRYGTRDEKRSCNADSLLILERMDRGVLNGVKSKSGAQIAKLVRNDQFRTPGSVRYSGGNGGRLVMDLCMWRDSDEKRGDVDGVEAFVVASCILMLKREADRFIDNNIAAVV